LARRLEHVPNKLIDFFDQNMAVMAVRRARAGDLVAIDAIEQTAFTGDRLSRRRLRYHIGSQTSLMLVLVVDRRVVGYSLILLRKGSRRARLYSIAIDPNQPGQGLGRVLLQESEKAAQARGARTMRLEVRSDNARAIGLYERNGYRRFAVVPDYYEDGATAGRFEKSL
jgi:[ribosomal protein S18]-alanine N-acetyltransferase